MSETKLRGRAATTGVIEGDYALSVGASKRCPPEGWSWKPLLSVARLESGHTPSRKHPEYWGGTIPWIGIRDATGNHGRVIDSTEQYTNELGISKSAARILPKNTVCLSRTASVGYVVVMGRPMATSQDFANWVCGPNLDHQFLKYVLLAEKNAFSRFSYGSTHQTIYYPELKAFHVCLPPLAEQQAIAGVLGALDDKIELNRRMNATLEGMARALFRSWFVDFDPVRAKAAGDAPAHMDAATAALFPDCFGEHGLPEGWSLRRLGDFVSLNYGKSLTKSARKPGKFPVYGSGGVTGSHDQPLVSHPTVVIGRKGTVGSLYWAPDGCYPIDTTFFVTTLLPIHFVYRMLQTLGLENMNTDAAVPGLNRENVYRLEVPLPGQQLVARFSSDIARWQDLADHREEESRTLAALRDALLPKLMSGELRVREAEAQVAEAV